ncbi:hypothetical protein ABOM_009951 [Aspergillus bombycis]|uniref:C6 transcription factor n=1 Tax=Aspergillus bombycis TaxID=109264 RepID=A0A1F7ZRC5_9EURO|nr:hypothetical protein ABOM_009951 [Aspergillus bombycis]OGM41668.1 hypothetical protein ABOM_009951 [Aspergillus bombycis]
MRLKWDQGVASRGKLTGRSLPMCDAPLVPKPSYEDRLTAPSYSLYLSGPRSPESLRLFAWFRENVAHRLAWINGPQNPWRQLILPLAESSETIFFSILALAAHDLASQYPVNDPWYERFRNISDTHLNNALALLAQELGNLSCLSSSQTGSTTTFSLTLGSVLILCNSDLLKAQTSEWRIHLLAAREIISAGANHSSLQHPLFRVQRFLLQEFYSTSVWTHLTTFSQVDDILVDAPTSNEDAVLADFVRIIHHITKIERVKSRSRASNLAPPAAFEVQTIYAQIESAKSHSLCVNQTIEYWSDSERGDFQLVVWMYYYATLIYGTQALSELSTTEKDKNDACGHILDYLQRLFQTPNGLRFTQDLIWPLFIAGTELRGDRAAQKIIENGFKTVIHISRTLDRSRVLSFLKSWWNLAGDDFVSWIDFARGRPSQCNFLIV